MSGISLQGFNADEHESASFEPIPADEYEAEIVKSEERTTFTNQSMLSLTISIRKGRYQGRLLFENLFLRHSNDITAKISSANLAEICKAVGVVRPQSTSDLEFKPFLVRVGQRKRKDTGEMENVIRKRMPLNGSESGGQQSQPQNQQHATGGNSVPPWQR